MSSATLKEPRDKFWARIFRVLLPWGLRHGHRDKEPQALWKERCLCSNHWVIISIVCISHLNAKQLVSDIITGS